MGRKPHPSHPDAAAHRIRTDLSGPAGFGRRRTAHSPCMDLRKPLLALLLAGSLVACGDNTDLERGETNCDGTEDTANNPNDASCEETGQNDG